MKCRTVSSVCIILLAAAFAPTEAVAGNCLSHPPPFLLQSDTVEWSMVLGRGSECIWGLRGRTMVLESIAVLQQPKSGLVILQGPSFRYSAGPEVGSASFKIAIVGTSARMHGSSIVTVDVQVR
jgi:hypothetical protein